METFKLNNKTYEVRWNYDFDSLTTHCSIISPDEPNKISEGLAITGEGNNFCKREGRKRSFGVALCANDTETIEKTILLDGGIAKIFPDYLILSIPRLSFEDVKKLYHTMKVSKQEEQLKWKYSLNSKSTPFNFTKEERTEIWKLVKFFTTKLILEKEKKKKVIDSSKIVVIDPVWIPPTDAGEEQG